MDFTIIHIGKCGGSAVYNTLQKHNIKYSYIHYNFNHKKFKENHKYLIMLRNPISRFISAFNWRYKLVLIDKKQE